MKINGTSVLHATREQVWGAITDPAVLAGVIPGCRELNPLEDGHFGLTVSMGVAAIRGTYAGEVHLYDLNEPSSLTMRAAGAGGPGTIDTTVEVSLTDLGDGTTRLDYDADAVVGGMAGGVGQRVLTSVAKKTAGLFFAAIDDVLTGKRPVPAAPPTAGVGAAAGEPEEVTAVPASGAPAAQPSRPTLPRAATVPAGAPAGPPPLIYVAVGAAAVAIGVLLGSRIGRRSA